MAQRAGKIQPLSRSRNLKSLLGKDRLAEIGEQARQEVRRLADKAQVNGWWMGEDCLPC